MARTHILYPGGYVKTTALSRKFPHELEPCKDCGRATCGPYWLHLETKEITCFRCRPRDTWEEVLDAQEEEKAFL